jgi:hypothetical protein
MIQTYYDPNLFKTNAKGEVVYDIFKQYKKENYDKDYLRNVKENTFKYTILNKEIKHVPVFNSEFNEAKVCRFPSNPTKNWGPKARAKLNKYINYLFK